MIYYFYKADHPNRSEKTIQGRPRASHVPPVTGIGGDIDNGTIITGVSSITMKPSSLPSTKAATTYKKITKTISSISTTSI